MIAFQELYRRVAVFAAIAIMARPLPAENAESLNSRVDKIFAAWNTATGPGAAVAVIHEGNIVFEKGYGLANLEYNVPVTPHSAFHAASVTKQFTAMALVLLERDGKLSLEDDVRRFLPELPDYGAPIKIRYLLQHTSGVRNQWQTLALAGWSLEDVITQDQILRMLFRQKMLNFAPNTGTSTRTAAILSQPKSCGGRRGCRLPSSVQNGFSSPWACRAPWSMRMSMTLSEAGLFVVAHFNRTDAASLL